MRSQAYADQPLKSGNIHISAPHIYCSILEALELHPKSSLSFLFIGFGTGYLSCIAAEILGSNSIHYGKISCDSIFVAVSLFPRSLTAISLKTKKIGVEIHEDVIQHSKTSIENWITREKSKSGENDSSTSKERSHFPLKIFHGNGLNICSGRGEGLQGFDRIYVGGGIDSSQFEKVKSLICPGGILVAPGTIRVLVFYPHILNIFIKIFFSQWTINCSK